MKFLSSIFAHVTETAATPDATLTPEAAAFDFNASLWVMLRGMLSILFVTAVLILLVIILNRYSKKKKSADK